MAEVKNIEIEKVLGFQGQLTIEVRVFSQTSDFASATAAFGKSEGKDEAKYLDPAEAEKKASEMTQLLSGRDFLKQHEIDQAMIDYDGTKQKQNLGGNVMLGTSIACARLAAASLKQPLFLYLHQLFSEEKFQLKNPRILYNLVEGGVHANNNLPIQEHLIIPQAQGIANQIEQLSRFSNLFLKRLKSFNQLIQYGDEGGFDCQFDSEDKVFELIETLAKQNHFEFDLGIDAAANNIKNFDPDYYLNWYQELVQKYPFVYLEDPFFEEGQNQYWQEILSKIGKKTLIAGDDLTVTNPEKLKKLIPENLINAIIIKPDQVGTLTETFETIRLAKQNDLKIIVSHRSQETTDTYLADLAMAVQADFVKFGAFYLGERTAKYNRLLEITPL
jgi:enolase